mmetsp:Transcript_109085/g.307506  ORF Transcript_109085/g.307506 Transcript_109085/m.307506 type:complete len:219 (-) Transcript_109085:4-660(-)
MASVMPSSAPAPLPVPQYTPFAQASPKPLSVNLFLPLPLVLTLSPDAPNCLTAPASKSMPANSASWALNCCSQGFMLCVGTTSWRNFRSVAACCRRGSRLPLLSLSVNSTHAFSHAAPSGPPCLRPLWTISESAFMAASISWPFPFMPSPPPPLPLPLDQPPCTAIMKDCRKFSCGGPDGIHSSSSRNHCNLANAQFAASPIANRRRRAQQNGGCQSA